MERFFLCLFFSALLVASARTQTLNMPTENVGIIYNRETTFNMKLTTNRGFVPGMEFGRLRTYYKTTFFHISLGEIKHPKEQRQSADPRLSGAPEP